jgi:phage/plasmid-associated DNA primase
MAEEDGHEAGDAFNDDKRLRGEVRAFICTMPELRYDGEWDAHGLTPLANGLFDAETRALSPYAAESRATFRFKAAFDVDAGFANGERMIRDLFEAYGEEADRYVWLIQQFAYVAIFKVGHKIGRQLRRCLYLLGEANSGKSQMLDLLRRVIGEEFSSSTTLDELSDQAQRRFALQSLMDKAIWAADEAASERTKIDAARLKAILAEDIVKTDAKGAKAIERRFLAATVFSSNSFPQTLDKASGFADRFMLVRCPASFDNENPRGVALLAKTAGFNSPADFVAATELSGFLNWALGARDWIEMEKRFDQPAAVVGMREEIADTANPVRAFVKECLEDAPLHISVKSIDIYEAYREWHAEDAGNKHFCLTPKTFWSLVNSYFGGKRGTVPRKIMKRDHATLVAGLKLNEAGEEFWRIASNKRMDGEKSISSTISGSLAGVHGTLDDFHVGVIKSYFVGKTRNDVEPAAAADAPAKDKRPRF